MTRDPETSGRPIRIDVPAVPTQELSGYRCNVGKRGGGQNLVQPGFPTLSAIRDLLSWAGRVGVEEQEPQ